MKYSRDDHAANPPYGERSGFRKITVTLPPDAYEKLIRESTRRKIAQEPNQLLSALLREAVMDYLERIDWNQHDRSESQGPSQT
jgi:hypothetical protein